MLLIVDDERSWNRGELNNQTVTVRTVADAIGCLTYFTYSELSLDHDLGPEEDIRPLIRWIEENAEMLRERGLHYVYAHTMNPVGGEFIVSSLRPYFKSVIRVPLTAIGELV